MNQQQDQQQDQQQQQEEDAIQRRSLMQAHLQRTIGEDVHFCVKALDCGFQTYVDHSLSMHIGHIGTYEYRWEDVEDGAVERHNSGK